MQERRSLGQYGAGELIDEVALYDCLQDGQVGFACLDVFADGPGLKDFLKAYYDWPRREPSTYTIACHIAALLGEPVNISPEDGIEEITLGKFANSAKRFSHLSEDNIWRLFSQFYVFDLYHLGRYIFRNKLSQTLRTEFYRFQVFDFIKSQEVWRILHKTVELQRSSAC